MKRPSLPEGEHIHMIGLGGVGVSALALIMAEMGYCISGSDMRSSRTTQKLASLGVRVYTGHDRSNINGAQLVVATAAAKDDNPEIMEAREKGLPIISRAAMLGRLMNANFGIAVSGTHGKTTTTSMLAVVIEKAGLDPTILIGGDLDLLNGNAKLGQSDIVLAEACEAYRSFLELRPKIAVVTNIEADHLDCYGTLDGVMDSFREFFSNVDKSGCAVVCTDCPNVQKLAPALDCRVITYSIGGNADCVAHDVNLSSLEPSFRATLHGEDLGEFALSVPGEHNVRNALATIAVGMELGLTPDTIREHIRAFRGAGRRFDVLGTANGITVVDDYAHHPTEVSATLKAARASERRVVAVFQPHLFSRTRDFAAEFADSLRLADEVFVTDIYAARELPIPGISGQMIVDLFNAEGEAKARFIPDKNQVADIVIPSLREGDLLIVMGAGDIRAVGEEIVLRLSGTPKSCD